ncbi:MAG: DUF3347 domain-containing protein [Ferruginibacter sp.]
MKKLLVTLAAMMSLSIQSLFAQDSVNKQKTAILNSYYHLKDNLVKSNSTAAGESASELINSLNATDNKIINDESKNALLKDASAIAQSKDIKIQREKFALLSVNMIELAKNNKLSSDPVYEQYCPMKKASWLSNEKSIKNPYYGSAMLTCGSVKSTY